MIGNITIPSSRALLLWSLSVSLVHKTPEIPETLSAVFNKWWGHCCNRPSVGVCVRTINVHELHAWKKDKDKKKKKKVVLHHSPTLHSLFPPSRNTSCQIALQGSRISRTHRFVLLFDLIKWSSFRHKHILFFFIFNLPVQLHQTLLFDSLFSSSFSNPNPKC